MKFTGKERDGDTGLDYFGSRYLSGAQGRFTSPDPPLLDQDPNDPQCWNLYSYVRNNPLVNIDPSGRSCIKTTVGGQESVADDGDGKGCEAAGVRPSNDPDKPNDAEDIDPQKVSAEERAEWLQNSIDFAAGAGNELTFGLSGLILDWTGKSYNVNPCSGFYTAGEWTGFAVGIAAGGGAGFLKSGIKRAGTEFSHFIPKRLGGPRTWANGNFVSATRHYKHDPYRRLSRAAEQAAGPKYPPGLAQLDRVPDAFKGAAGGAAYGTASMSWSGGCPAN